ncbi:hypothetical protein PV08_09389 [Exophiala spinifera]|uniref:Uncharacterized protein n=1 Tax=Exophiala spinifera TaxID=91928 RepID=A0A0D2B092_9EURO|nr:uncharacterized protein PV08_09389 [Exophiala spinifera]KIW12115.1 hypothetical protein PV08_09389 [Exophiala spinifera]
MTQPASDDMYSLTVGADAQDGSPLFTKLPAETRVEIFSLALKAEVDTSKPYRPDRFFYRPGYHYHTKINQALLLTCKRIYEEARLLPIAVNEHVFWLFNGPGASVGRRERHPVRWDEYFHKMNTDQRQAVQTVHIFAQQMYLESLTNIFGCHAFNFKTTCLHLTIRHFDWWSWESPPMSNDRLGICPWRESRTSCQQMLAEPPDPGVDYITPRISTLSTWGGQVCQIKGLRELKIEFEIAIVKKPQLQAVIERAKTWKFPLVEEDVVLMWMGTVEESTWEGLQTVKADFMPLRERPITDDLPKRKYYVVTMTWVAVPSSRIGYFRTV